MAILEDLLDQLHKWPISVVVVVALSFGGVAIKKLGLLPSKFIPSLLMVKGTVIYILVSERGSISPTIPYPSVVLGLYGCILGMIAWIAHGLIWKFVSSKFPGLKNGETQFITKHTDETPPK